MRYIRPRISIGQARLLHNTQHIPNRIFRLRIALEMRRIRHELLRSNHILPLLFLII
jgi:hypothetical protein